MILKKSFKDYYEEITRIGTDKETKHNLKISLVYFTPWNKKGSEMVIKYAKKVDIASPVWFDLKPEIVQGKYNTNVSSCTIYAYSFIRLMDLIILTNQY